MSKNSNRGAWRARVKGVEYDLTLDELSRWIVSRRVEDEDDVQPPSSEWRKAKSAIELQPAFEERDSKRPVSARDLARKQIDEESSRKAKHNKVRQIMRAAGCLIGIAAVALGAFLSAKAPESALLVAWFGAVTGLIIVLYTFTSPKE